jgi:twitching motility protein PilU
MYLDQLFKLMAEKQASDPFAPAAPRSTSRSTALSRPFPRSRWTSRRSGASPTSYDQGSGARVRERDGDEPLVPDRSVGNFRISILRQRGTISLCIRYVRSNIPPFDELKLRKCSSTWS